MDYKAIYKSAASILRTLTFKEGTLRSAVEKVTKHHKDNRDLSIIFALVVESLKYFQVLQEISEIVEFSSQDNRHLSDKFLLIILLYETLLGSGSPKCGPYRAIMQRNKVRIQSEFVRIKIKMKAKKNEDLIPKSIRDAVKLPRWIRINTLKCSIPDVISDLSSNNDSNIKKSLNLKLDKNNDNMYIKLETNGQSCGPETGYFYQDDHIPELLALPNGSDLRLWNMYKLGKVIIQDKASCFPSFLLNPPKDSIVLDACAAPGNKTSHLSAIMNNTGKIFALDLDNKRLDTLKKLCNKAGCQNIEPLNQNFLEIDYNSKPFSNVEYILLDPSCSGSGIVGRLDHLTDNLQMDSENPETSEIQTDNNELNELIIKPLDNNNNTNSNNKSDKLKHNKNKNKNRHHPYNKQSIKQQKIDEKLKELKLEQEEKDKIDRLESLAQFQENAIKHALSFPKLKKMTYSTCSKWERENEQVIENVLNFAKEKGFKLETYPFPNWNTRGLKPYPFKDSVIRTNPKKDLVIGFFVAVFTKDENL